MSLTLVYDGGCPFCRHFALRSELVGGLPDLEIRDGQAEDSLRAQLKQRGPQAVLSPAIADLQIGEAADQLATQGEVAAKRTTAVVDEGKAHCAILNTALLLP